MIKEKVKKIPLLGALFVAGYKWLKGKRTFTTSNKYWETRYKTGGNSGAGSYNNLAEFKGEIINSFVVENSIETVIEYGCGDGNQLKYFSFKSYIGYDVSKTALKLCADLYKNDHSKQFKLIETNTVDTADLTLSLDVIYHLVEDEVFISYMEKLFSTSNKYVIIYSSNFSEDENKKAAQHVRHRKFTDWVMEKVPHFKLIKHIPNKYPLNENANHSTFADFYIFEKEN